MASIRAELPEVAVASMHAVSAESIRLAAGLPHKLALGEILVFRIRDGHVLAATNLHGRLVFGIHPVAGMQCRDGHVSAVGARSTSDGLRPLRSVP